MNRCLYRPRRLVLCPSPARPSTRHRLSRPDAGPDHSLSGSLTRDPRTLSRPQRGTQVRYSIPRVSPFFTIASRAAPVNEVSLLRAGPQAAKLRLSVDGRVRLEELVCDGVLVATPAGSTAYNYSAHGPVLPIGSGVLALTAIAPFRPRRRRGALLPQTAEVLVEVLDPLRRPVMADADSRSVRDVTRVVIRSEPAVRHRILFDPGHGLEERLLQEQFV